MNNDLTVSGAFNVTSDGAVSLSSASNFDVSLTSAGTGDIVLTSTDDVSVTAAGNVLIKSDTVANSGTLTLQQGLDPRVSWDAAGAVTVASESGQALTLNAFDASASTATGGAFTATAGAGSATGGAMSLSAGSGVTGGALTVASGGGSSTNGAVVIDSAVNSAGAKGSLMLRQGAVYTYSQTIDKVEITSVGYTESTSSGGSFVSDGRLVLCPGTTATQVGVFDPETNSFSQYGSVTPGRYTGAATTADDRVVFTPTYAKYVGLFDPSSNTFSEIDISSSITTANPSANPLFTGPGALAANGDVIFAPYDENAVGVFTPTSDTFTTVSISSFSLGTNLFIGACAANTGNAVYLSPRNSDKIGIFDPTTSTFTVKDISAQISTDLKFRGCTSASNDKIIFHKWGATGIGVYVPGTDAFTLVPITGSWEFTGGVRGLDGKIYLVPFHTAVGVFDPVDDSFQTFGSATGTYDYSGIAMSSSGSLFMTPFLATHVGAVHLLNSGDRFSADAGGSVSIFAESDEDVTITTKDAGAFAVRQTFTIAQDIEHVPMTGYTPETEKFFGSATVSDGRIVFAPFKETKVGVFNPASRSKYATYGSVTQSSGGQAYFGATVTADDRVVFTPYMVPRIGIFDPSTNAYSEVTITVTKTSSIFKGNGALATNGQIIFPPHTEPGLGVYTPSTNAFTTKSLASYTSASAIAHGACAANSGNLVYLAPWHANVIIAYDPTTDSFSNIDISATLTMNSKFRGCASASNDKIIFSPYNSDGVGVLIPSTGELKIIPTAPTNYIFDDGVRGPDGKIYMTAYSPSSARIGVGVFDPITETLATVGDAYGSTYSPASVSLSGDIILTPRLGNAVGIIRMRDASMANRIEVSNTGSIDVESSAKGTVAMRQGSDVRYYDEMIQLYTLQYASGSFQYEGVVKVRDGRMVFCPHYMTNVLVLDPRFGAFTINTYGTVTNNVARGATLTADGQVVCTPISTTIGVFDPHTNTYSSTSFTSSASGGYTFVGDGALAANGNVIFAPAAERRVGVYTPSTATLVTVDISASVPDYNSGGAFYGACTWAPGELIFFAPADHTHIGIFDGVTNTYSQATTALSSLTYAAQASSQIYRGCTAAKRDRIVFHPRSADAFLVYTPSTGACIEVPVATGWQASAGTLGADGKIYITPLSASQMAVFDPDALTYEFIGETHVGSHFFYGVATTDDGDLVFAPAARAYIGLMRVNKGERMRVNDVGAVRISPAPGQDVTIDALTAVHTLSVGVDQNRGTLQNVNVYVYPSTINVPNLASYAHVYLGVYTVPGCLPGDFVRATINAGGSNGISLFAAMWTNDQVHLSAFNGRTDSHDLAASSVMFECTRYVGSR